MELNDKQREILTSTFIGTLSTIRHSDGMITSNPVSFIWNGEDIEISTLKSRMKHRNLLADSRATLCAISPDNHLAYVELRGRVQIEDDTDKSYLRYQFNKLAGEDPPEDMDPPGSERVILYLRPEQVSSPVMYGGRFDNKYDRTN